MSFLFAADTLDKTTRPTSIYLEIPNNSFARTLSNPEIVSKKRKEMANDKNPSVDKERSKC
jgi:hypothetical protein